MEARDSSSSLTPAPAPASRDGGPSLAEDDAVLSVAAAFAKDAALHFQSGKFAECADVLRQLLLKKPGDLKILHNIAIAEYFRDGCSDPKKLLDVLNSVKKRSEELAQASLEQLDAGGSVGNKGVSGSKGSNALTHQFSDVTSSSIVYMDQFDVCVGTLNIAIIWFHLHDYTKALSVLEPLYQNIGPIDETIALNICLLLLDVALACNDSTKSADVLMYLEKAFGVSCTSQGDNGGTGQQQSVNLVGKSSSLPSSSFATDGSELVAINASERDKSLSRTLSEDNLDYESFDLDIDAPRSTGLSGSNDFFRSSVDRSASSVDLKLKLQLYKVRFLLLARNLKQAKREVKHAMNIARGRDSSMALLLKSQLEYTRGNHRKAIKLLMASSNRTDMGVMSMFHNNLGCIYYQLGKYHTAGIFFSKALTICSSIRREKAQKLSTFSLDHSLLIVYNCGMQYLACGKPLLAARCFQKAGLIFYNRPLLWLRVAECCLMALEKGLLKTNPGLTDKSGIRIGVIGKGKWRHLVLENGVLRNGSSADLDKSDLLLGSDKQPNLSLSLARHCLHNSLYLLNHSELSHLKLGLPSNSSLDVNEIAEMPTKNTNHKYLQNIETKAGTVVVGLGQANANGDAKEQKAGTSLELVQNSLVLFEDLCKNENLLIKQTLLANLAYVDLELGDPVKALVNSRYLLELPECSRVYLFLGNIFAAEALCLLNRQTEAIEHLSIYLSEGTVELPFSQEDWERRQVDRAVDYDESNAGSTYAKNSSPPNPEGIVFLKPEEARTSIYVNFAVMFAMLGDLDQAHRFVSQVLSVTPNCVEATVTAVYIDLKLGKSEEALAKLKQCGRVTFLSGGVTMNKALS